MVENKELEKFTTELEVEMSALFQVRNLQESVTQLFSFEKVRNVEPRYDESSRKIIWKIEVGFRLNDQLDEDTVFVFYDNFDSLNVVDVAAHLVKIGEMIYDELNFQESDFNETEIKEAIYGKM